MAMVKDLKDPESLNMPDDSAHNAYNNTTLKNADEVDEDGHYKRTGALRCSLPHTYGMYYVTTFLSFAALLASALANKQQANCITVLPIGTMKAVCNPRLLTISALLCVTLPREVVCLHLLVSACVCAVCCNKVCNRGLASATCIIPICTASAACVD